MKKLIAVSLLLSLVGCSWMTDDEGIFRDRKKDYRKAQSTERITVPAGLDSSAIIDFNVIPEVSPFADPSMIDKLPLPPEKVTDKQGSVKIQVLGDQRWLLVNGTPSRVWPRLKRFLGERQLQLTLEEGAVGVIEARNEEGVFRFKIEQGFQLKATEISLRHLTTAGLPADAWPVKSVNAEAEQQMLNDCAQYLANSDEDAVYSFAAQGISTTPKMRVTLLESGLKALVFQVSAERARASLERALAEAGFVQQVAAPQPGQYLVQYQPALPEDKKPGWFKRMLGFKPKPYDDDIEFAGHDYRVLLSSVSDGFQVTFQLADAAELSVRQRNRQLNQMLDTLKGYIN